MHRILITFFIIISGSCLLWAQPAQKVQAAGEGLSKQAAIDQAKRAAVEQTVGSLVAAETFTKNFQLVSDRILSKANGYVKTYKEISSTETPSGFRVEIEAEVTAIFDELLKDEMALELLLDWLEKPRFMIMVEETNLEEPSEAAETELTRKLAEKRFDLVSREQVKALRESRQARAAIDGGASEAAAIAADFGAEMILVGKASTSAAEGVAVLESAGMKSAQAVFSARIVDAGSGRILASFTTHAPGLHISPQTAGAKALNKAASMMADSLAGMLLKRGSEMQLSARMIKLTVSGVDFSSFKSLKESLAEVTGVSAVHQRSFRAPVCELAVEFAGTAMDLATALEGYEIGAKKLSVSEVAGNTVSLKLSE